MLKIKICFGLRGAVDRLPNAISVVGMNSPKYQLQRGLNCATIFKDPVGFLRPVDLSAENASAEAACTTYTLPLGEESFAALQLRIEVGVLQRNRGLGSQHLQQCDSVQREGARG